MILLLCSPQKSSGWHGVCSSCTLVCHFQRHPQEHPYPFETGAELEISGHVVIKPHSAAMPQELIGPPLLFIAPPKGCQLEDLGELIQQR